MTAIETPNPDDGAPAHQVKTVPLPSREHQTAMQLQTLTHTAIMLNQLRLNSVDEEGEPKRNDGGVASSVDVTLMKLCDRIDTILEDSSRWNLKTHGTLEKKLSKVYAAHLELIHSQKQAVEYMQALHREVRPTFLRLEDGRWAALIGDVNDRPNCIIGVGDSMADALEDVNNKFYQKHKQS